MMGVASGHSDGERDKEEAGLRHCAELQVSSTVRNCNRSVKISTTSPGQNCATQRQNLNMLYFAR